MFFYHASTFVRNHFCVRTLERVPNLNIAFVLIFLINSNTCLQLIAYSITLASKNLVMDPVS